MPHFYPIVIQSGKSLVGDSLGFHAYSLRIDNLTNQWLIEETSMAWIPPYSLGVCLRLYGTGVAIILNQAPAGQPQPSALAGEQTIGVYSDQLRTEVGGTAVRQFTLVQAVSDLTQGPEPAFPPVGITRLWSDTNGNVHRVLSNGADAALLDSSTYTTYVDPRITALVPALVTSGINAQVPAIVSATALGGELHGTVANAIINNGAVTPAKFSTFDWRPNVIYANDITADRGNGSGAVFFSDATHYLFWPASGYWILNSGSGLNISGGALQLAGINALQWDGSYINWVQPNLVLQSAARIYFGTPGAGTYFLSIDTNIAWIAHLNGMVRFYRSASGHYTDFTTGADWTLDINTQGSAVSASIFHIRSQTLCQIQVGRSANELQINQHMYGAGSGYFVLDVSCTTLTQRSSLKWKHSVVPMDEGEALRKVLDKRVNLYSFQYELDELQKNADENRPPHSQKPNKDRIGFAAEEMNLVVPECVAYSTDDDAPEGINYAELVTLAWGAIRELNQRLENAGI